MNEETVQELILLMAEVLSGFEYVTLSEDNKQIANILLREGYLSQDSFGQLKQIR